MFLFVVLTVLLIHDCEPQLLSSSGIKTSVTTDTTKPIFGPLSSSGIGGSTPITTVSFTTNVVTSDTDCPEEVKSACLNGATCQIVQKYSFKCLCRNGFTGFDCGTVDPNSSGKLFCESSPCKNDSTCFDLSLTSGICFCQERYTGAFCETRF